MVYYIKNISIVLFLSCVGMCAQFLMKRGLARVGSFQLNEITNYIVPIFTNIYILSALGMLTAAALVYFSLLSRLQLSSIYPIVVGVNFALLVVGSRMLLNEAITLQKLCGIILIMIGVIVIFMSRVRG